MDGTEGCAISNDYGKKNYWMFVFTLLFFWNEHDSNEKCLRIDFWILWGKKVNILTGPVFEFGNKIYFPNSQYFSIIIESW